MQRPEDRLEQLGMPIAELSAGYTELGTSQAKFVSHRRLGNVLYLSGTVPLRDGRPYLPGVVGQDLTLEQGYEAARWALRSGLVVAKYALTELDRVEHILQMTGYVNSAPGFHDQPRVINGATDLLVDLYGDRGFAARAAIGCQGLGLGSSVEIVLSLVFSGDSVREPRQTAAARATGRS